MAGWAFCQGGLCQGVWARGLGSKSEYLGQGARIRKPGTNGIGLKAWARGSRPGGHIQGSSARAQLAGPQA